MGSPHLTGAILCYIITTSIIFIGYQKLHLFKTKKLFGTKQNKKTAFNIFWGGGVSETKNMFLHYIVILLKYNIKNQSNT